jgi:tRNA splicing endonuclease
LNTRNQDKLPQPISFSFVNDENGLSLVSTVIKTKHKKLSKEEVLELFKDNSNKTVLFKHFRDNGLVFTDASMCKLLETIPQIDS